MILLSCKDHNATSSLESLNQQHPKLILTKQGVEQIRNNLGQVPLFDQTLKKNQKEVDEEMATGIHVPVPKDFSGGYTHERHKKNFLILQKAGVLYQILEDEKYAQYIKEVLFEYAKMYPNLPKHPQERSYARGKLFWQCLNDANWLVYVSQAYDCVYEWMSKEERVYLEKTLFRPFADYLSVGNPQFFNRIHNHSTWGNVAVGMIGLVMDDEELINRALYGLNEDYIKEGAKDNDGGLIKEKGEKAGFLANVASAFSPDGYYTEGPYYQRYAMYPFMLFAQALYHVKPDTKIYEYKNGVLLKSVYALLNLTDSRGEFYPLNDAQKGMSYHSRELVSAVNIAYYVGGNDSELLSIIEQQNRVPLDESGLSSALAIKEKRSRPFIKKSMEITDGTDGTEGGIGIIRSNEATSTLSLLMKYTAQGKSHGHYDKLSFSFYDNGQEVIQDYGMVRFVNIEQKGGGNYLKENTSWAKQTIAHNTITQNERSHFGGDFETGNKYHSDPYFFDVSHPDCQIMSAKDHHAYPNTLLHRTMALIQDTDYQDPLIIDIFRLNSKTTNQYDLPYYYLGQLIAVNFEYHTPKTLSTLGTKNGYQHLWNEGSGIVSDDQNVQITWLANQKFYTMTTVAEKQDELIFARVGATDPNFNLRRDPAFIIRSHGRKDKTFVSVIEPHGHYSPVSEIATNAFSNIANISIAYNDETYTALTIEHKSRKAKILIVSNKNESKTTTHELKIKDTIYKWKGVYYFGKLN